MPEIEMCTQLDLLKYIICTKVGDGPKVLSENESLLNREGHPLFFLA